MRPLLFFSALLAVSSCASSGPPQAASAPVSDASISPAVLAEAAERGVAIFERDRAAWLATDAMFQAVDDPVASGVRGWVTEPTTNGLKVTFVAEQEGVVAPLYEAWVSGGEVIEQWVSSGPVAPLPPALANAYRARQTVLQRGPEYSDRVCAENVNTVVLPVGESSAPPAHDVYVLSASNQPGVIVAGGHFRVRVASRDFAVIEDEDFTSSCLNLPPPDENVAAIAVTNGVSPAPNEIHVFLSLFHQLPVYVTTRMNGRTWLVDGPNISEVEAEAEGE